jgi:hypothetical protein
MGASTAASLDATAVGSSDRCSDAALACPLCAIRFDGTRPVSADVCERAGSRLIGVTLPVSGGFSAAGALLHAEHTTRTPSTEMTRSHRSEQRQRLRDMCQNRIDAPSEIPKRCTSDSGSTSLELK